MPFTLAHPFAALPFRNVWRQGFIALAYGTVGPDIPYFLPRQLAEHLGETHTWSGAVTWGASLAFALLVATVLLRPLITAPMWGRHKVLVELELAPFSRSPWMWAQAVPAVMIGSVIHVACDSTTHRWGWIVRHVPALSRPLPAALKNPVAVYTALQYGVSVAGLLILASWYRRELQAIAPVADAPGPWRARVILVLCLVATYVGAHAAIAGGDAFASVHDRSYIMLTGSITTFVTLYLLLGLSLVIARQRR